MKAIKKKTDGSTGYVVAGILALIWMCIIFAFSAQDKQESSVVSEGVSYELVSSTGFFFHLHLDEEQIKEVARVIESTVRKAAHMTEFLLLAVWAGMLDFRGKFLPQRLLFGLMTALVDETIQLYTGRTSLVTDVWIDYIGFAVGTVVVWFIARWKERGG